MSAEKLGRDQGKKILWLTASEYNSSQACPSVACCCDWLVSPLGQPPW